MENKKWTRAVRESGRGGCCSNILDRWENFEMALWLQCNTSFEGNNMDGFQEITIGAKTSKLISESVILLGQKPELC
jgi:hypothetical protein